MVKVSVYNSKGQTTESVELPEEIFGGHVNTDVIHQAVVMYQAAQREGNLATKGRGEISGGGKKPFRQKGTGQARAGSTRSPLWHHGAIVFGPQKREFRYSVPKKVRSAALRESLKAKCQSQDILCVNDITESFSKTKEFAKVLDVLKLEGKILAVLDGSHESVNRASRNIPAFNLMRAQDVNAYDILRNRKLLVSKTALNALLERVQKSSSASPGTGRTRVKASGRAGRAKKESKG